MITVGVLLNLENLAGAQLSGYNFNSLCSFNGKIVAADASGIYEIGSTSDNGTAIDSYFEIPQTDLGMAVYKRIRQIEIDGYTSGSFTMTVVNDETEGTIYTVNGVGSYGNRTFRIGMNSNDYGRLIGFKFRNSAGSDFSIRSIFGVVLPTKTQFVNQTGALGRGKFSAPMCTGSASGS